MKQKVSKQKQKFNEILKNHNFSIKATEEIFKWYDSSKKKGIANF